MAHDHALAPVLRWLLDGVIVLDRGGLRATQEHARAHGLLAPAGSESAYHTWFGLNYNLAEIRRLLQSDDPWRAGTGAPSTGATSRPARPGTTAPR